VISGSPTEGEQVRAAEEAALASPTAVAKREESQTKYEGLSGEAAEKLAGEVFPGMIHDLAGGPPSLPAGQRITDFPTDNAARVDLLEGKHGVIESTQPMAIERSPGQRTPIDLTLGELGSAFEPHTPMVGVRVPKRLSEGVRLTGSGLSLTPVTEGGSALGGSEGVIDGATVFYGNTEDAQAGVHNVDTLIKPNTLGFSEETVLRSEDAPQQLYFKVGMLNGMSLQAAQGHSEAVNVIASGQVVATIATPAAHDVEGTAVPATMSVSGNTLIVTVAHKPGQYSMPILVDPTVIDGHLQPYEWETHWVFARNNGEFVQREGNPGVEVESYQHAQEGKWALFGYATLGKSHIYGFTSETASTGEKVENELGIVNTASGKEAHVLYGSNYGPTNTELCVESGCAAGTVTEANKGNTAYFEQVGVGPPAGTFVEKMSSASVKILQEVGPSAPTYNESSPTLNGKTNLLYAHGWFNDKVTKGVFEATASDPGIGLNEWVASSPTEPEWKFPGSTSYYACVECEEGTTSQPLTLTFSVGYGELYWISTKRGTYNAKHPLVEGENAINLKVSDAAGLTASAAPVKLKVDNTPPHGISLAGLPSGNAIGEESYHFTVKATDGEGSTKSSGVKSIAVAIDGREIGKAGGSCSEGPCTGSAEWEINGNDYGAGEHRLTVTATDNVGNVATEGFTVKVHHATPVSLGPGSVNPQSGELSLGAMDVSVSAPGSSLTVGRSYRSRHLAAGSEGPLGPQWSLIVGGQESMTKLANGSMTLTAASGGQTTFASIGSGKFTSPTGDANLTVSETKNGNSEPEYLLKNAAHGLTTRFTAPGGSGSLWKPTKQEGPLASQTVRYIYQTVEGVTRPKYALAPEPVGLSFSCISKLEKAEKLEKGCRALEFQYAEKTKESIGEGEKEWGEYKARLKQVLFEAYNPAPGSEKMEEKAVAEYSYDKQGRLRAEWNPQFEHPLKMIYGYDPEGHVAALTPPGQESWAFTYGMMAGDASTGRLLKATQAPASAKLWGGEAPKDTEAPHLTGTPVLGVRMAASNGVWTNEPVAYSYQWEDCNSEGKACTAIVGASNQNYSVAPGDVGHTLVAEVIATNGGGAVIASSAASAVVASAAGSYTQSIDSGSNLNAVSCVPGTTDCVVSDSKGNALYATNVSASGAATWKAWTGPATSPSDALNCPTTSLCLIADGSLEGKGGSLYHAGSLGGAWTLAYTPAYGVDAISCVSAAFCVDGQDGGGYFRYSTNPASTSWTLEDQGTASANAVFCLSSSFCAIADSVGNARIATTTSQVESSSWTSTDVDGSSALHGIACTSTTSCVAVDGAGNVLNLTVAGGGSATVSKHDIDGTNNLTAITCANATCVTVDSLGNIFVSTNSGSSWTKPYTTGTNLTSVSCSSATLCVAADTTGKVTAFNPAGGTTTEGEAHEPQPGSTVEYHVPLSGAGLSTSLTKEEVEKWGQKDDPTEGTAIFPPDEPQGWPASKYTRATIIYMDEKGQAVNTVSPSGAISTTEYTETHDVGRTLSPDNRVAALNEGCKSKTECKSAEVSKLLDTESTYNTTGSEPGTQLLETLGPQHTVKLAQGKEKAGEEVLARDHAKYYYNEGAPSEGGPYDLVTKSTDGAQTATKEEFDIRETTTSYAGQGNLGWKLRKPTAVTTDPSGLQLTHTTLYEASTGEVIETRMPANSKEKSPHATETIYYTAKEEAPVATCRNHPEWANLPCQTQPAKQPETSGLPNLSVTTFNAYNVFDELEKTTETVGSTTRTKTATYDGAGRLKTSATTSTVGTALPTITYGYTAEVGAETGALTTQSVTVEGKTKKITSVYNTLGQLASYIDADENTSSYEYEIDGRIKKVSDGKGTQSYTYDKSTGLLTELVDSSHEGMKFTATYDVEGNALTETYPNGMTANYTYNATGKPIVLEYKKTTHCAEKWRFCSSRG
jgi:YD repeat-containing protein